MESAENGFKKHHLIPFSQKIPRVVAASLTSREEKLSSIILSLNEKKKNAFHHQIRAHVPSTPALLWQTMKFFRKRKETRNRLKCLRMHHLHPFFSKNFSGRSRTPPPLPRLQRDIP